MTLTLTLIEGSPMAHTITMKGWDLKQHEDGQTVTVPQEKALQAYEVLLGDSLKGDQSYFVTFREVVAGYKAWDAVMAFVPIQV